MPSPSASNNWPGTAFDVGLSRAAGVCAEVRPKLIKFVLLWGNPDELHSGWSVIATVWFISVLFSCCLLLESLNLKPPDCIKQALPDLDAARRGYRWLLHGPLAAAKQSERKTTIATARNNSSIGDTTVKFEEAASVPFKMRRTSSTLLNSPVTQSLPAGLRSWAEPG